MGRKVNALVRFVLDWRTRYVLSWVVCLTTAAVALWIAWTCFDSPRRRGGNNGHTTIDFGGQWLLGRMLASGHGPELYHREYQRALLMEAYPRDQEIPEEEQNLDEKGHHEAEDLMVWLMGQDDVKVQAITSFFVPLAARDALGSLVVGCAEQENHGERSRTVTAMTVGGSLYPPIHALIMYPLGLLRPAAAYRLMQVCVVLLAFVTGWAIRALSHGRVWWPVAVTGILLYPGFNTSLCLGQNSMLVLTFLFWGWLAITRGQPVLGEFAGDCSPSSRCGPRRSFWFRY